MTGKEISFIATLAMASAGVYFYYVHETSGETEFSGPENDAEQVQPSTSVNPTSVDATPADPDQFFDRLPGLYIQLADQTKAETGHLLFITADLELYKLARSQVKYVREYVGSVDPDHFKLNDDGSFSFYDYHGRLPTDGEDIPMMAQLTTLLRANQLAKILLKEMNEREIELSLRLDRDRPQFTDQQIALLEKLVQKPEELANFMLHHGVETLWINDYLNERLYISDGYLVIPAALKEDPGEILRKISERSYEPDLIN